MGKQPRASILIPTYNSEKYIEQCLRSAMEQTITDIEIIVSDNCSSDNTIKIVETLAKKDNRIKVLKNTSNEGPVKNWLNCLKHARSEFSKIIFSDDWIDEKYLEYLLPELEENSDIGFVYSAVHTLNMTTGRVHSSYTENVTGKISSDSFFEAISSRYKFPVSPTCGVFRTEDLLYALKDAETIPTSIHPYEYGAGPDMWCFLWAAYKYPYYYHFNEAVSFFRAHDNSITVSTKRTKITKLYQSALMYFSSKYLAPETTMDLAARYAPLYISEKIQGNSLGFCRIYEKSVFEFSDKVSVMVRGLPRGVRLVLVSILNRCRL